MPDAYAVIMAGGAGTRLWPLSRQSRPKPLLPLVEPERSLFQTAVERLSPLFPPDRVMVVAGADLTPRLREAAPDVPPENFIVEPMGRDTAPAVGLGAIHVLERDPDAVMAILTADHHIADAAMFRRALGASIAVAAEGGIVTLGITPRYAATGFGYIERGPHARTVDGIDIYELLRFKEKPDAETAAGYIASGKFSWNSGMFIWRAGRVMDEFALHAPDIHAALERLAGQIGQPGYDAAIAEIWPNVPRISVDYALLEHIDKDIYVVPVEMGWDDIGNFNALYQVLAGEVGGNVVRADDAILVDTRGVYIQSDRPVTVIGLEDIVIVDTEDALLVCRRDRAQDVKQIVQTLKRERKDKLL
jgi:mannose-1-phosphate guanylyltransferase